MQMEMRKQRNAEKGEKKATMLAKIYGQFCAFFMCENHLAAGGRDRQGEGRGAGNREKSAQLP